MEFNFETLDPRERYKLLIGSVVPRPIALVTTIDEQGVTNAAPFSFFNCFSHDPPILIIGVEERAGAPKDTVRNIRATKEFVISVVSEEIAERMNICAVDFPAWRRRAGAGQAHCDRLLGGEAAAHRRIASQHGMQAGRGAALRRARKALDHPRRGLRFHIHDNVLGPRNHVDIAALKPVGRLSGNGYAHVTDRFELKRIDYATWLTNQGKAAADND